MTRLALGALLFGCIMLSQSMPGDEDPVFESRMIFEGTKRYPSSHCSTITQVPDGAMLSAWYAGAAEKAKDVAILGAKLDAKAENWSEPFVLHDTENLSDGNPVLYTNPWKRVWLFFVTIMGDSWNESSIFAKTSDDSGKTWSEPATLRKPWGWMTKTAPVHLGGDAILLPLYDERNYNSMFMVSQDKGKTWKKAGKIFTPAFQGNIQPSVVKLADGSLLAYMRASKKDPHIWESRSMDGGMTWTNAIETRFKNPDAAVFLLKLQNGHLVLVFNDSQTSRSPLSAALSTDEGKSWCAQKNLEDTPGEFSYPYAAQSDDGIIHVTYTYKRTGIKHASFNEAWLLAP